MMRTAGCRAAALSLALALLAIPVCAADLQPRSVQEVRSPLAALWQAIVDLVLPEISAPTSDPPAEQPQNDLGPTLDPIG